jgi:hypothetical protein
MKPKDEFEEMVTKKLEILRDSPTRNPLRTESGRTRFLNEAQNMKLSVSPDGLPRLSKWKLMIQQLNPFTKKETRPMTSLITSLIVIFSLILGGGGITVAAAQSSQPDSPLYEIKLLSEEAQLALISNPEVKVETTLDFAARRLEEIQGLLEDGQPIPAELAARYDLEVAQAIQYALNQPDNDASRSMAQIQTQLENQARVLEQIQANGNPQSQGVLLQTRDTLQERLQLVSSGLGDITQLRIQLQQQAQLQLQQTPNIIYITATPQAQGQQGGWVTGTPTPGSSYGPGPGLSASATCTPKYWNYDGTSTQNGPQGTQQDQGQGSPGGNDNK